MGRVHLQTEHLRTKPDRDGLHRTVQAAGAAMPALLRVLDDWKLLSLIKMDHVQRAV